MSYKQFNPDLIEIRKNPFSSTRSSSISTGVFIKGTETYYGRYFTETEIPVYVGILKNLKDKLKTIEDSESPQHVMIFADYGQGKSFAMKIVQDKIIRNYNGSIVSFTLDDYYEPLKENNDYFCVKLMELIEMLYANLNPADYLNKEQVKKKCKLDDEKNYKNFLKAYDKAFKELKVLVYIFIDELDKIIISDLKETMIKTFLEALKTIADECSNSISLFIAGTPTCNTEIDKIGIDYLQRFDTINTHTLNENETKKYIRDKCKTKLRYIGYIPFTIQVINKISALSKGNIRQIEYLCRELWNISSRKREKIDSPIFDKFLLEKSFEPIKGIIGNQGTHIINFIGKLIANEGKIGDLKALSDFPTRKKNEIMEFIEGNPNVVKKLRRSYMVNTDLKQEVLENLTKG